ncbi:hypothetical protein DFH27DRAFT_616855 [Peziza echinospora]|nr:hypothetical protein DFH27DRAFT_616855 [Peziza echinospora]
MALPKTPYKLTRDFHTQEADNKENVLLTLPQEIAPGTSGLEIAEGSKAPLTNLHADTEVPISIAKTTIGDHGPSGLQPGTPRRRATGGNLPKSRTPS